VLAAAKIVDFPLKRTELSKSHEVPRVRRDHGNTQAGSAHCNQRVLQEKKASGMERRKPVRCVLFFEKWWARQDLNLGPTDYESAALTAELRARRALMT
jgi:hypothetical protein